MNIDFFYGPEGPTAKQKVFRDSSEIFKLYGGAIGGGKSRALCAEILRLSMAYAGNRCFMCRDEAKAFKETTLITLFSTIRDIQTLTRQSIMESHSKSDQIITLVNGSTILYGGIGGRENHDKVKSMELGAFAVDEASETNLDDIDMLETRLRWKLPSGKYPRFFGFYASNPEPGWLKQRFVVGKKEDNRIFVQALPSDNKWLPEGYIEQISKGKPDYWVKRYVEGSWDASEGQIWPSFDYNIHVLPNECCKVDIKIPTKKLQYPVIFGSYDHGIANPSSFLSMHSDVDGNIFVSGEYYSPGFVSEHCKAIINKFPLGIMKYKVADPSIWNTIGDKQGKKWSLADQYRENGITFARAFNNVSAGLDRVGEYLYVDENHRHPFLETLGSPRVFISDRCVNLIREISDYTWKKQRQDLNEHEAPKKLNDHSVDAFRYGIMSRPHVSLNKKMDINRGSFLYWRNAKRQTLGSLIGGETHVRKD